MRQFGRVDAPVEQVRALFQDVAGWPDWMPSIERVEVRERSAERTVAEVSQTLGGRRLRQTLEFRYGPRGYRERQLSGRLKSYEAAWWFLEPPEGGGTVVSARFDFDLGLGGLFVSRRSVERTIGGFFRHLVEQAEERLRAARDETAAAEETRGGETRIRLFEVPEGLEVWIDDRRYLARPVDGEEELG